MADVCLWTGTACPCFEYSVPNILWKKEVLTVSFQRKSQKFVIISSIVISALTTLMFDAAVIHTSQRVNSLALSPGVAKYTMPATMQCRTQAVARSMWQFMSCPTVGEVVLDAVRCYVFTVQQKVQYKLVWLKIALTMCRSNLDFKTTSSLNQTEASLKISLSSSRVYLDRR